MVITQDIKYVGVNDNQPDLFEGQYKVDAMAYNSYVILDQKIAVIDTVDKKFGQQWLSNLQSVLQGREPDYLIVEHMEPDHSSNIVAFAQRYPNATVVVNNKTVPIINNFFGANAPQNTLLVDESTILSLGNHQLQFVFAPMVHWPEVMMTYDATDKVLFSADAFGRFGANDPSLPWLEEARRYYIGIVGKYGAQVQSLFKKVAHLPIKAICPLHGVVLTENLDYYLQKYTTWATYGVEEEGVLIAYTSVYGNTKQAVMLLEQKLRQTGVNCQVCDLARCDMAQAVALAFKYGKVVLATTTYNADIFPFMRDFIIHLAERNFQNRTVGVIENGSWAPMANNVIRKMLANCKNIQFCNTTVTLRSAVSEQTKCAISTLAQELAQ